MAPRASLTAAATGMMVVACIAMGAAAPQRAWGQAAHRTHPQPIAVPESAVPPVITLERTGCHSQCAEYKLSFYDDGQVIYEGKANVSKGGRWRTTVGKQALAELVTEFQRTGYSSLNDKYPAGITETSTAITSLRLGDKTKTVSHEVGSPFPPAALVALEDRIDASVQSVEWVR
jgi:Domain of unknown function (DUF6438)